MSTDLFNNKKREVICDDSHNYLIDNKDIKCIVTSLPDMEEIGCGVEDWTDWMKITCRYLAASMADKGVIIFYQTDRKYKGRVLDKKTLISSQFEALGFNCIYSKIVLKQKPNTINLFRPSYTNLFGFSKKITSGKATPDVFEAGKMMYKNAMGLNACVAAITFAASKIDLDTVVDPFCGMGSVLKTANNLGFNAVGIDILKEQTEKAKII